MNQEALRPHLEHILENAWLITLLLPILDLVGGQLMGYEALWRGHGNSPLQLPQALFAAAAKIPFCRTGSISKRGRLRLKLKLPRLTIEASPGATLLDIFTAPARF